MSGTHTGAYYRGWLHYWEGDKPNEYDALTQALQDWLEGFGDAEAEDQGSEVKDRAFQEGYDAYHRGEGGWKNPYPDGLIHRAWWHGYCKADNEDRDLEYAYTRQFRTERETNGS